MSSATAAAGSSRARWRKEGPCSAWISDQVRINRVVFVAAPNRGTLLADPDHMVEMLDRMTTALNLFRREGSPTSSKASSSA